MTPPDKNNLGISIQQYRNAAITWIAAAAVWILVLNWPPCRGRGVGKAPGHAPAPVGGEAVVPHGPAAVAKAEAVPAAKPAAKPKPAAAKPKPAAKKTGKKRPADFAYESSGDTDALIATSSDSDI